MLSEGSIERKDMAADFTGNLRGPSIDLPHFWEHTVGSGHATLALRADWQTQLKRAHEELGMQHVRFHGMLVGRYGNADRPRARSYSTRSSMPIRFSIFCSRIGMKPVRRIELHALDACRPATRLFFITAPTSRRRRITHNGRD